MTDRLLFGSIPVEGEPYFNRHANKEQWGEVEFRALLEPILTQFPDVTVGWSQYTPYFNDGDVCEFGAGEVGFTTPELEAKYPYFKDNTDCYESSLFSLYMHEVNGGSSVRYNPETKVVDEISGTEEPHPAYALVKEFANKFEYFQNYLYEQFGDHAIVKINSSKVTIEGFEHD